MISVVFFALELPTTSANMTHTMRILIGWGTPFEIEPKPTPVPRTPPILDDGTHATYALGFARSITSF
jgi:hypothetical protein